MCLCTTYLDSEVFLIAAIGEMERAFIAGHTAAMNVRPIPNMDPTIIVVAFTGREFSSGPNSNAASSSCNPNAIGNPNSIPNAVAKIPTHNASVTMELVICLPVAKRSE